MAFGGTFDWKGFSFTAAVPKDTESMILSLGLEKTTGTVRFDPLGTGQQFVSVLKGLH